MGKTRIWPKRLGTLVASPWGPLLVTLALGLPRLRFPLGDDAAVFSNAARTILDGSALYRDIWFNGFPLNPLLYAGVGGILGLKPMTPHFIHLLESLTGVALVYVAGHLALDRKQGLIGSYIFGLFSMLFIRFDVVAEPEFLAGLGSTATTILLLVCLDRYQSQVEPQCGLLVAGAGLATGIAIAAKVVALPLVVLALFWMWKSRQHFRLRHLLYYTLGAAVVPLALLIWLATSGVIGDMIEQVITFNGYYSRDRGPLLSSIASHTIEVVLLVPVLPLAVIGTVLMVHQWNVRKLWLVLWAGAGVAAALVQAKPWNYHWFVAIPALSLLCAQAFMSARRVLQSRVLFWSVGLSIAALAALLVLSVQVVAETIGKDVAAIGSLSPGGSEGQFLSQFPYMGSTMQDFQQVATYLINHSEESDRVFVWMYTSVYVMAQRRPASKHAYRLPLVYGPERLQAQARAELMADLRQQRPPYVVLPARPGRFWKFANVTIPVDPFPELLDFVANNYVREVAFGDSVIYRLRQ